MATTTSTGSSSFWRAEGWWIESVARLELSDSRDHRPAFRFRLMLGYACAALIRASMRPIRSGWYGFATNVEPSTLRLGAATVPDV